jgi:hypothetical protein
MVTRLPSKKRFTDENASNRYLIIGAVGTVHDDVAKPPRLH